MAERQPQPVAGPSSMAEDPGTSFSDVDEEDPQLKIRIPNPRVYLEKQYSQWQSQRGRVRCDYCRGQKLKCDRVLPRCNHCALGTGRDCTYTQAHAPNRGTPRCNRCREQNLRGCDRGTPACNLCATHSVACTYSNKGGRDSTVFRNLPPPTTTVAVPPRPLIAPIPIQVPDGECSDGGIYTDDEEAADAPLFRIGSSRRVRSQRVLLAQASASARYGGAGAVQPWMHPIFAPLPRTVLARLARIRTAEMPPRLAFDSALVRFVDALPPSAKETAALSLATYVQLMQALTDETTEGLSHQLTAWARIHHVWPGSTKTHRLILLREEWYHLSAEQEQLRLRHYRAATSAIPGPLQLDLPDDPHAAWCAPFARVPVQPQIFDLLAWAHRSHNSAASMLKECERAGFAMITWPMTEMFIRLCPLCGTRPEELHTMPSYGGMVVPNPVRP